MKMKSELSDAETADALEQHWGLIHNQVRRILRAGDPDFQDTVQSVALHLLEKSIPQYRRDHGPLGPYLKVCSRRAAHTEVKRLFAYRERERPTGAEKDVVAEVMPAGAVEVAVRMIATEPEKWLTQKQAQVLRELRRSQGEPITMVASRLGYASHAGLSMAIRRIRDRLSELDLIDLSEEN